jgi:hypothetical protein
MVLIGCSLAACTSTPGRLGTFDRVMSSAVSSDGRTLAASTVLDEVAVFDLAPLRLRELEDLRGSLDRSRAESSRAAQGALLAIWLLSLAAVIAGAGAGVSGGFLPPIGPMEPSTTATTRSVCHPQIVYSRDGRFVATTAPARSLTDRFQLVVADLAQQNARLIGGIYGCSVAFSTDSRFLITGGPGAPQIWNAETGQQVGSAR